MLYHAVLTEDEVNFGVCSRRYTNRIGHEDVAIQGNFRSKCMENVRNKMGIQDIEYNTKNLQEIFIHVVRGLLRFY